MGCKRVVKYRPGPQPDMRDRRGMPEVEKIPQRLGRLITSPKAYANQKTLLAGLRWLRANRALGRVESEGFDPFWVVTKLRYLRDHSPARSVPQRRSRAHPRTPGVGRYGAQPDGRRPTSHPHPRPHG